MMSIKSKRTAYTDSLIEKSESTSAGTWSEWSDSELNAEPWDSPKSGEFSDPRQVEMPMSLQPTKWKRFQNLKNVITPTVFEPIYSYPDLIINNKHILHSEFMRCFVSTLINIQYCGRNGLQIENQSKNFSWNLAEQCWQGWYQIYSLNKAGKGVISHRPIFNPKGRYVVRIFLMGCWRRILLDDSIPIDKRGRPLLPRTANNNELWPMLLAKAMLKIAALSWTPEREVVDCNLITCLTGWIGLSLNVSHLSPRDQWEFITKYAKHFEWPQEEEKEIESRISNDLEKGSKRKSKTKVKKLQIPEEPQPILIFLSLEDMRDVDAEEIPGVTPCWNHQIFVELSRDVPLDPMQVKPPLAKWKLHRWLDWAINRGLIDASEYFVPTRHLLIVSPLREYKVDVEYSYNGSEEEEENEDWQDDSSRMTLASKEQTFKKKIRGTATTESSKDKGRESSFPDISLWGDFNKLSLYLREVHLFYRQKFFKHSIEVSDNVQIIPFNDGRKGKSETMTRDDKMSRKSVTPRSSVQPNSYEYQDKLSQSRNEPLYLFVDSTEDKFFFVNLSTMNLPQNPLNNSQSRRNSSLIIEKHNWFDMTIEKGLEVEIKTRGTKSTVFQLETGRQLLQIFISCEFSYHVTILSDTQFQIGNRLKMHRLMTAESENVNVIVQKISVCTKKAFESFGNSSYAADLKIYYQSYMPNFSQSTENANPKIRKNIHCYFKEELSKYLEKIFETTELPIIQRALRIFFLDPSIGREVKQLHYFQDKHNWKNVEVGESNENRSATIVQSFFRMILIKGYKKIHDTSHKEHNRVKDRLLRIVEFFNYEKHESAAQILLRAVIKRNDIYKNFYPCTNDFKHVIHIQELKGRISNILPDQWIPIVRVSVNAPKWQTVHAVLHLFTNLSNHNLRVFDNDTKREMLRSINNVTPMRYRHRRNGYTIFAYGQRDNIQRIKELEWSMHLTTMKGEPLLHWFDKPEAIPIKSEIPCLMVEEISNNYIPNIRNCILKLLVRIKQKCLLTLRLKTSYKNVMTKLRVVNENGENMAENEGGSTVILPLVFLEHVNLNEKHVARESEEKIRKSKRSLIGRSGVSLNHRSGNISKRNSNQDNHNFQNYTQYFIEAFVRDDSWPLTEAEWVVAMEAKSRSESNNIRFRRSSTLGKVLLTSERSRSKQLSRKYFESREALEQPYWILQIVTDDDNELEVLQDKNKENRINELKKQWKTDETGRSQRGNELRERFLEDNCLIIAPSVIDTSKESITDHVEQSMENVEALSEKMSMKAKRTLEPPVDFGNYLPKLDLSIYMEKDDEEENSWVKSEYDEETLRNQRAMNVLDFEQLQSIYRDETSDSVNKRRDEYRRLSRKYLENSANRIRVIDEAYKLREAYSDATKNTVKSVKSKSGKEKK